eukprot:3272730-Rhodomonas_salina.1
MMCVRAGGGVEDERDHPDGAPHLRHHQALRRLHRLQGPTPTSLSGALSRLSSRSHCAASAADHSHNNNNLQPRCSQALRQHQ